MYNRLIKTHLAIFSVFCFLFVFQATSGLADQSTEAGSKYTLSDVKSDIADDSLTITLKGSSPPAYTSRELYDPYRLIIDIAEVQMGEGVEIDEMLAPNKFVDLQTTIVRGLKPEITRFTFTIKDGFRQKVERQNNDLVVRILPLNQSEIAKKDMPQSGNSEKTAAASGMVNSDAGEKIRELIASSAEVVDGEGKIGSEEKKGIEESFAISGYKRERISVDFYKIDLHNVFRLFRQISGINLIVDEGVKGTLTLALKDVPWDFALDIILNLSNLEKEEKFNTIVIYPKKKEFEWPKRASDNLSFEANLDVVEKEALIIQQSANQPKEIMQAKELMRKARIEERDGDFEDAAKLYEQAAKLWPDNASLSNRLAAIYLVRLGMNAKGVFFAKKSLEAKPDNYKAALYAAIGSANMNKISEAVEYFDQSISGTPPMKEALASFAAFSETNGRPSAALKLYDKYQEYYGETVNTMVAKARIYDNLGLPDKANDQYKSLLASGFQLQVGLKKYIQNRLAETN